MSASVDRTRGIGLALSVVFGAVLLAGWGLGVCARKGVCAAAPASATPAKPDAAPSQEPAKAAEAGTMVFKLQPRQKIMGTLLKYYRPMRIELSKQPKEKLKAEPAYASKQPLYGAIDLGTGPDRWITVVVDEAEGQPPRIYIDRNHDRDLTNDGDGAWTNDKGQTLSLSNVVIQVPYETGSVPYTFEFYRFKERLREFVLYYRNSCREGEIVSDGKSYKIAVMDENADGRFDDLANGTLLVDLNQDGKLDSDLDSAERYKLNEPFNVHGKVWEVASLSPDGLQITLRPSAAKVEMRPYLDPGCPAPAFSGKGLDGRPIVLKESARKAKYILVDFWATWCGPCRAEFPALRRIHARYKDHGLQIVGVDLDDQENREKALALAKTELLDYPHVFDGLGWKNAVAVLYRVHSIPRMYLLDADLKIVAKNLRGSELEARLEELLGPGDAAAAAAAEKLPKAEEKSPPPKPAAKIAAEKQAKPAATPE